MIYLSMFRFPDREQESSFSFSLLETCYDTAYPFGILTKNELTKLSFEPITVLYGGNGSGKTTALNIMAEKLGLDRDTRYNRSNFFENYTDLCEFELEQDLPKDSRIVTSDDVFDFMLNLRCINEGVDEQREELFAAYYKDKNRQFRLTSLDDYEQLRSINMARKSSKSKYVRESLSENVREHSNGESAYLYFMEKMREPGLYLLDEPENSLSPERQMELQRYLIESARFFQYQFIIATHSPFLLSMKGARVYDFDADPAAVKPWTLLENVRSYYNFFKEHEREFEDTEEDD